jgi:hypothetical protein
MSTSAASCPKCGATKEKATGRVDLIKVGGAVAALALFGNYLWSQYGPLLADYRLRQGYYACRSESAIVQVRGAGLIGGSLAQAAVAARNGCIAGPKDMKMTRIVRGGISEANVAGVKMYVDHDGFEKR